MNISSYLDLLPPVFRRRTGGMILIGILRRLLDLVGLASLLPIIVVILDPASVEGDSLMAKLFQLVGLDSVARFGMILGAFALLLLPLKSIVTIWLGNIQNKYYLSIYRYYSLLMYRYYHSKGLLFIRQTYSSQLAFHINGACYGFSTGIVGTIVNAASDLVMTLLLTAVAIWFAPWASLMLFAVLLPVLLIYFTLVKERLKKLGRQAYEARRDQGQIVQESLRGHVSINVNNSFDNISREFEKGLDSISKADLKSAIYGQIPSLILQVCIALALVVLLMVGGNGGTSVTLFVVFGFVAMRIMPSILSLANSWNVLQNNRYIIDIIRDVSQFGQESGKAEEDVEPMNFEQQIEMRDITFAFEGDMPVLSDFSLCVRKGESVGFSGASGAGKSTLFNLLLGFYVPQQGGVYIDGEKLSSANRKNWHKIVGYVEQEVFIKNDTLARNIALSAPAPDNEKILRVLEQAGLTSWLEGQKEGLETMLGEGGSTLSGGERQRIGIARALYKDPQILFVDESTSALDVRTEENIVALLHSLNRNNLTLLIISHRESALRFCNRIIYIN